jgi:hypothetical protein
MSEFDSVFPVASDFGLYDRRQNTQIYDPLPARYHPNQNSSPDTFPSGLF